MYSWLELAMWNLGVRSYQTGISVHILLPTAIGVVKSSGSGQMPLQSLVVLNSFLTAVLECQGALDLTVRKERCSTHDIINARLVACDVAEVLSYAAQVLSGKRV